MLDDALLKKVMMYQKDGEVRRAVFDALSENHKTQLSQLEWKMRDEREAKRRDSLTEKERKKEDESSIGFNDPKEFCGNIFEAGTVDEYILRYGVDPRTSKLKQLKTFSKITL